VTKPTDYTDEATLGLSPLTTFGHETTGYGTMTTESSTNTCA